MISKIGNAIPWNIVFIAVAWKIGVMLLIFLAATTFPFQEKTFRSNFTYPLDQKVSIATSFKTWDGQHYLFLAEKGYGPDQPSNAFQPLYPIFVKVFTFITQNHLLSGLFVSNAFSLFGIVIFYKFTKDFFDKKVAFIATCLLLSFPTAFFFGVAYTEGLFFFLLIAFYYSLYKRKLIAAALSAFLLMMVRDVGIFIILPLLIFLYKIHKKPVLISIPTFNDPIRTRIYKEYLLLFAPLAGLITNFLFLYFTTGDPFSQFTAERYFIAGFSLWNLLNPTSLVNNFFASNLVIHGFTNSYIDRVFFVGYLLLMPLVYKKVDKVLFITYVLFGITPVFGSFMAYTRYILLAFPLFMALGKLGAGRPSIAVSIFTISLMLQAFFIVRHALSYWVA